MRPNDLNEGLAEHKATLKMAHVDLWSVRLTDRGFGRA